VDTEILPALYGELGAAMVDRLDGMFAMAVWDERDGTLFLARDRTGEKPLFYCDTGRELVFASELRALWEHPDVPRRLDPVALRRYLFHGYFPAPLTPIAGVRKLPAAHTLTLRDGRIEIARYWDLADSYAAPRLPGGLGRLARRLDEQLSEATRRRLRSDVPLGVLLSGGIDSSTLLAHATDHLGHGVPVFALGHEDADFDESRFARETARHFGAEYHELILGHADLDAGLRKVAASFDEPLGDASTIPTLLISEFARQRVKVVLSGDGGDELFGGYPTYLGHSAARFVGRLPAAARRGLTGLVNGLSRNSQGNVSFEWMFKRFMAAVTQDPVERHHTWFGCFSPGMHGRIFAPPVLDALRDDDPFASARACVAGRDFPDALSSLLYTDFCMYLQDDLLTKVDRASMLASLEARGPFLDHKLAEFAARIPVSMKVRGWSTKVILKRAGKERLPGDVLRRRKRGFNIPFSRWLSARLGGQVLARFSSERLTHRGLFNADGIPSMIREHLQGEVDHGKALFAVLALDLWCDRAFGDNARLELGSDSVVHARAGSCGS
jgi:asparagine synthase (glutamine-hydrolysing)